MPVYVHSRATETHWVFLLAKHMPHFSMHTIAFAIYTTAIVRHAPNFVCCTPHFLNFTQTWPKNFPQFPEYTDTPLLMQDSTRTGMILRLSPLRNQNRLLQQMSQDKS